MKAPANVLAIVPYSEPHIDARKSLTAMRGGGATNEQIQRTNSPNRNGPSKT